MEGPMMRARLKPPELDDHRLTRWNLEGGDDSVQRRQREQRADADVPTPREPPQCGSFS
jgi:hypothetical protein